MKAIRLTIKNVGIVADAVIELNKPLILFYGEIRQGKTTLLNAVKWVFGGTFPTDIIRNGETEGLIKLDLDCGTIIRSFYVAKDGTTKARALIFEKDGTPVRDPVAEIKKFLNPFLLDQNFLAEKSELERKKYFAQMFAVDTGGLDAQIALTEGRAAEARSNLKAYGDIDLTPVLPPADLQALHNTRMGLVEAHSRAQGIVHGELAKRRADYTLHLAAVNASNRHVRENNSKIDNLIRLGTEQAARIERLKGELNAEEFKLVAIREALTPLNKLEEVPLPPEVPTADLEAQISNTAPTTEIDALIGKCRADQVLYDQFVKNQTRQKEREAVEASILTLDATARELRAKKLAKLQECGKSSGIEGLEFGEAGNFIYEGCQAGMLSTSQLMKLSSKLSALYPEGFGIDLIDRAESLGRSVFDFIEQAKAENKTILAAIVGERPAAVPAEVGVFVVENGRVQ